MVEGHKQGQLSGIERIVAGVERVAAIMLGLVTVLIFLSVVGRYLFSWPVPDSFDVSRLTLAVAIMWGFASLGFRGSHIKVDILAMALPGWLRRWTDIVAWSVLLVFTLGMSWKIAERILSQWPGGEVTMDLRLPHWPFLIAILFGVFLALLTTCLRLWRIARLGEGLDSHEAFEAEDKGVTTDGR